MTLQVAFRRDPEETLLGLNRLPIVNRLPTESQHCAVRISDSPSPMYQCRSSSFFLLFLFFIVCLFVCCCCLLLLLFVCLFLKDDSYSS